MLEVKEKNQFSRVPYTRLFLANRFTAAGESEEGASDSYRTPLLDTDVAAA